jgi:TPR repeat protein
MEPLLPSLHNLPVFFTVLISLLLMAGLSAYTLVYRWLRQRPPGPGFTWLKAGVLLPLLLLTIIWTGLSAAMGVFVGGVTGSWPYLLLGLAVVPVFALLSWGLYLWVRSRTRADIGMLLLVPAFIVTVYSVQRLWLCEPLALSGLGHAQLCTARLYERGEGGAIRNQGTARYWYRAAAEQGVAEAEYQVAGFTREREQKLDWYTRAADHGHAGAAYRLYWLLEKDAPEMAVQRLQAAVHAGHAGALYRMGVVHRGGRGGVDKDPERTRALWIRAAKGGYITAMRALAIAYARGILFDHDPELSRHWEQQARELATTKPDIPTIEQFLEWNWERLLQKARERRALAEAGDADAQLAIGREILQKAGTDPALIDKALGWIERAAETGSMEAQYQLANHYLDAAAASEREREQGRQWLLAAADSGQEEALRKVITAYKEQTYGFPRDLQRSKAYSEALFAVLKARGVLANQTDWMITSWEYSDTLQQIKKEAERYLPPDELKRQSDAGDPAAQYHQAKELQSTSFDEGVALMIASAKAGYPQAQYEMATSYRHRKRTEQEEEQAIEWLTAAAESGHRGAMVDLGAVYLRGIKRIGMERNPYRAKQLFEQALRGREGDVIYEQKTHRGSWQYTMRNMNIWLAQLPEAVQRLDLEGLQGAERQQAIEQWYTQERETLQLQAPESESEALALQKKQLEQIEQQRAVLLKDL